MLFRSDAGAVMVMLTSTPVPELVTVSARSLLEGGGEASAVRGVAAVLLSTEATTTLTDTPGGKPSAGAAAAAPGEACTTATAPCRQSNGMFRLASCVKTSIACCKC